MIRSLQETIVSENLILSFQPEKGFVAFKVITYTTAFIPLSGLLLIFQSLK